MKNILIKSILLMGIFSCTIINANAQDESRIYFNYIPALTIGEVTDYVDEFSWRGASMEMRFPLAADNITMGFVFGWNVFREESDGIITEVFETERNTISVSANQYRFVNALPILITGHYYFGSTGTARPYIGTGAGIYLVRRRTEMGLYTVGQKTTHFGLAPVVGVAIPVNRQTQVNLAAQYNYAFSSGGTASVSYIGFNVGMAWLLY